MDTVVPRGTCTNLFQSMFSSNIWQRFWHIRLHYIYGLGWLVMLSAWTIWNVLRTSTKNGCCSSDEFTGLSMAMQKRIPRALSFHAFHWDQNSIGMSQISRYVYYEPEDELRLAKMSGLEEVPVTKHLVCIAHRFLQRVCCAWSTGHSLPCDA